MSTIFAALIIALIIGFIVYMAIQNERDGDDNYFIDD